MLLKILLFLGFGAQAFAQGVPVEKDGGRGWTLGLQKVVVVQKVDAEPVGLSSSDLVPPVVTGEISYQPNYEAIFQPDLKVAYSWLKDGGGYLYVSAGGWFDFPKFHLFVGGEGFGTVASDSEYDGTLLTYSGLGGYVKGAMPLGRFYPSFEIRLRGISRNAIAVREGITTYVDHKTDTIVRPALNFDLGFIDLWGAITSYNLGDTAVASEGFGYGIKRKNLLIQSLGAGIHIAGLQIWGKLHHISNIEDESAHVYQAQMIYPDFLLAKDSASLEVQWNF